MCKKILFLLIILASGLNGQTGQTGGIRGTVFSQEKLPLPGTLVTLRSEAMVIEKLETITNENGKYRFIGLNPGTYELTYQLEGMNTVIRKGIVINANINITVDISMAMSDIRENIVVEGKAPTIDRQSTANTSSIDANFISSVPATRNLGTYFNMTPGVTGNSAQGSTVRDNSYNLDGVQMNDPVVGTSGSNFSVEIMEEVSVQTGGLSAEHGSVKGAVINVITKSGGNRLSGTISAYYDHESLQSDNTGGTPLESNKVGSKYRFEPGISIGGPIIKDKLWFFTNLSINNSESYTSGFPANSEKDIATKDKSIYPYIKLSYQPTQKDKFVLSANYSKREIDYDGASKWVTKDYPRKYDSPDYVISGHWTHTFNSNLITNMKVGYFQKDLNWTAQKQTAALYDAYTWISDGSYGWDDENTRKRLQVNLDATWFKDEFLGSHEIKGGFQMTHGSGQRKVTTYGEDDGNGFRIYYKQYWKGELYRITAAANHNRKTNVLNLGFFVNDTWNVTDQITLNIGLRYDYSKSYVPKHVGTEASDIPSGDFGFLGRPDEAWNVNVPESIDLYSWKNITPRLGVVYDLLKDGTTLIKFNYARYLQDNYSAIAFDVHPVNWISYGANVDADGNFESVRWTYAPGASTKIGYNGKKLKAPHTDEVNIAVERELWEDWSVSLRAIRKWDRDLIETVDANALNIEKLMETGELEWTNFKPVDVTDPLSGNTVTMWEQLEYLPSKNYIVNAPGAKRDYKALEFGIRKRFSHNWSINASYVISETTGLIDTGFWDAEGRTSLFTNPNAHVNAYGDLEGSRKHQFKLSGVFRGPWGINLSGYLQIFSGYRYTRTLSSRNLELDIAEDPSVKAEKMGSNELPTYTRLDLRLEKEFRLGKHFSIKGFVDIFNLFNSNATTSVITSTQGSEPYGKTTGIQNPRIFRFGTKIQF